MNVYVVKSLNTKASNFQNQRQRRPEGGLRLTIGKKLKVTWSDTQAKIMHNQEHDYSLKERKAATGT